MTQDISRLTSLKSIVDDVLIENSEGEGNFLRYLRFAERCTQFLSYYLFDNVKSCKIVVDKTKLTAPFPMDMAKFSRLCVIVDGELKTLSLNPNLEINRDINCGEVEGSESVDDFGDDVHAYIHNSGIPFIGDYRMNERMGVFEFSSNIPYTDLILEYISTGLNQTGETLVPEVARETIMAWINWKRAKGNERQYKEVEFNNEYIKLRQLELPPLHEMMDVFYKLRYKR